MKLELINQEGALTDIRRAISRLAWTSGRKEVLLRNAVSAEKEFSKAVQELAGSVMRFLQAVNNGQD
jgi:hypothetical protein